MSSSFLCPVFPFSRFLPQNPFILSKVQKYITIFIKGEVIGRWGKKGTAPDQFRNAPRDIWIEFRSER